MADISKNTEIRVLLDGQVEEGLIEWKNIEITANYEDDNVQPSLSIDNFNFKLNARQKILNKIEAGLTGGTGIFEGMPFEIQIFNQTTSRSFKGYLDFTKGFQDFQEDQNLSVSIMKSKGLDNFFNQIDNLTYGYLESIGIVGQGNYSSIDYVVEKKVQLLELIMLAVTTYVMLKELIESIVSLIDTINKTVTSAIPSVGLGVVVNIGSILYAVLSIILRVLYIALILVAIINMGTLIFELFISPKRTHKMINLRTAMQVVCTQLGYTLDAPDILFTKIYYLPSNPRVDDTNGIGIVIPKSITSGIPNSLDYGYNCGEMFQLCKRLINGRFKIDGTTVVLRSKKDPYWTTTSIFNRSVLLNNIEYNTDKLKPSKLISFQVDPNDEYTIDNFTGTNIEIRTIPITVANKDAVLLKGVENIRLNTALGNVKTSFTPLENSLNTIAGIIDGITSLFGGGTHLANKIKNRIGSLKVSDNYHSIPKLLYIDGSKVPFIHRALFSAVVLYDNYHYYDSFVLNNFGGQRELRNNVTIPFGFNDFNTLVDNAYCTINQKNVKINEIKWKIGQDNAIINFEEKKPYTKNLKEIKLIP